MAIIDANRHTLSQYIGEQPDEKYILRCTYFEGMIYHSLARTMYPDAEATRCYI